MEVFIVDTGRDSCWPLYIEKLWPFTNTQQQSRILGLITFAFTVSISLQFCWKWDHCEVAMKQGKRSSWSANQMAGFEATKWPLRGAQSLRNVFSTYTMGEMGLTDLCWTPPFHMLQVFLLHQHLFWSTQSLLKQIVYMSCKAHVVAHYVVSCNVVVNHTVHIRWGSFYIMQNLMRNENFENSANEKRPPPLPIEIVELGHGRDFTLYRKVTTSFLPSL